MPDEVLPERVRVWVDKSVEDTEVETRDLSFAGNVYVCRECPETMCVLASGFSEPSACPHGFGWVEWSSIRSVLIDSDGDCEVWEG
ncbi:hypothetical protein [Geoglobus ahangari]